MCKKGKSLPLAIWLWRPIPRPNKISFTVNISLIVDASFVHYQKVCYFSFSINYMRLTLNRAGAITITKEERNHDVPQVHRSFITASRSASITEMQKLLFGYSKCKLKRCLIVLKLFSWRCLAKAPTTKFRVWLKCCMVAFFLQPPPLYFFLT